MELRIVTIGVYGFEKDAFFQSLVNAHVDTFCDIRLRRGMRGSSYAFVNSKSLQQKLGELGIRYIHVKELAPSQAIREKQKQEDKKLGIAKRMREGLAQDFIQAYKDECLSNLNPLAFIKQLGQDTKVVCLFCVEREPDACHRSLVAKWLAQKQGLLVEHIRI